MLPAGLKRAPEWFPQVFADLKRHEGFRLFSYPDPCSEIGVRYPAAKYGWGKQPAFEILRKYGLQAKDGLPWSVGYGFTRGVNERTSISLDYSNRKLETEIFIHVRGLEKLVPAWDKDYPVFIQAILANLAYNMGVEKLAKFAPTLALIKQGKYSEAALRLRKSLWYKQTGSRARELIRRLETGHVAPEHKV